MSIHFMCHIISVVEFISLEDKLKRIIYIYIYMYTHTQLDSRIIYRVMKSIIFYDIEKDHKNHFQ